MVFSMEFRPTPDEEEEIIPADARRCLNLAWALPED